MKLLRLICLIGMGVTISDGANIDESELIENIRALRKLYNFVNQNIDDLNFDGAFGIEFATVLLKTSLKSIGNTHPISDELKQLIILGDGITKSNLFHIENMSRDYYLLSKTLLDNDKWSSVVGDIRFGGLRNLDVDDLKEASLILYITLTMSASNTPTKHSDHCLSDLIKSCRFSKLCQRDILDNKAYGYPLNHRLLHVLVARFMQCDMSTYYAVEDQSARLCAEILMETDLLRRFGVPTSTKDLFIEQVLLCGSILGYEEFLTSNMRKYPILWQESSGCFTEFVEDERKYLGKKNMSVVSSQARTEEIRNQNSTHNQTKNILSMIQPARNVYATIDIRRKREIPSVTHNRKKRFSQYMGTENCRSHITGLAAGVIAGNIRYLLH